MSIQTDPAVWLVVELVICVQVAIWLAVRFRRQPWRWYGVVLAIALMVVLTPTEQLKSGGSAVPDLLLVGVPLVLGALLSLRAKTALQSMLVVLIALVVGAGIDTQRWRIMGLPQYAQDRSWKNYYRSIARSHARKVIDLVRPTDDLAIKPPKPVPEGYIDDLKTHDMKVSGIEQGPIFVDSPRPLWHSWLTGIYGQGSQNVLVWTPGGEPVEAIMNARLVPIGPRIASQTIVTQHRSGKGLL